MSTPNPSARQDLAYAIVDVFAEHPLEGNSLAVFADGRHLTTAEMQAIARETNLSETTFILPRSPEVEREHGVQVRIFTTQEELPFAGHPTLGTASWLHRNHPELRGSGRITVDLPAGRIPVEFFADGDGPGVFGTMGQRDPEFGPTRPREQAAQALGLAVNDLDPDLPVQTVSTGLPFCIVPLRSVEVAARINALPHTAAQWLAQSAGAGGAKFFYFIAPAQQGSGADWHARMHFYNGEDPATGSAAGCAIAYLVQHSVVASGQSIVLEQGVEMGRPSRIHLQAARVDGHIRDVRVGGRTILIASGMFFPTGAE